MIGIFQIISIRTSITIFIEGDYDLLDTINEWYHNPITGDLWVMTDGTNPNELDVKGKTSTYSFDIKNSKNITIENLFFFSSTIKSPPVRISLFKIVILLSHLHQKE